MDEFYIERVLKGDCHSFQYFVDTYTKYAFSLAYTVLKENHLAEDIVQESFIKAYNGLKNFKGNSKFKTWFGRIVINESLKKANKNSLATKVADEIALSENTEVINASIDSLLVEEQKYYITMVFDKLPPEESLALDLFYLQENSIAEIIELTGWSTSKTKMLLLRGRKRFYLHIIRILKTEIKELI